MKALADVSTKRPIQKVNSNECQRHLGQYTTIDHESPYMLNAIKLDLNQKLGILPQSFDVDSGRSEYDGAEEVQMTRTIRYRCTK